MRTQKHNAYHNIWHKNSANCKIFIKLSTKNGAPQHLEQKCASNCYQTNSIANLLIYNDLIFCLISVQFVESLDLWGFRYAKQELSTKLSTENGSSSVWVYKSTT